MVISSETSSPINDGLAEEQIKSPSSDSYSSGSRVIDDILQEVSHEINTSKGKFEEKDENVDDENEDFNFQPSPSETKPNEITETELLNAENVSESYSPIVEGSENINEDNDIVVPVQEDTEEDGFVVVTSDKTSEKIGSVEDRDNSELGDSIEFVEIDRPESNNENDLAESAELIGKSQSTDSSLIDNHTTAKQKDTEASLIEPLENTPALESEENPIRN